MTMLCVSVAAADPDDLAARLAGVAAADVVELRLDAMPEVDALTEPEPRALIDLAGVRTLVTIRPAWQGGGYVGEESRRLDLLRRALAVGAWKVDVELDSARGRAWAQSDPERVLLSHHWLEARPADLEAREALLRELRPSIAKLVAPAEQPRDALPVLAAGRRLRAAGVEAVTFCMGAAGRSSRLLDVAAGAALMYCSDAHGPPTAAGQFDLSWVRAELGIERWTPAGARFGLIGDPIGHSLSPTVFNAAFAADGSGSGYVPVAAADFADALALAGEAGLQGVSVTMPFKTEAASLAATAAARSMGAVNTLVHRRGQWEGHNTDGPAVVAALRGAALDPVGSRVLLLGAGGAARAAAWSLRDAGATVLVANRTRSRAVALAAAVGGQVVDWEGRAEAAFDAVINATPVGLTTTAEMPIATDRLAAGCVAMEMVYRPLETAWLRRAREHGCRTVRGLEMFLHQAAAQYCLWTGADAPLTVMRAAARRRLEADEEG
jgi:3-dehydroquinate dehydratase/shikimate dehydrogenase